MKPIHLKPSAALCSPTHRRGWLLTLVFLTHAAQRTAGEIDPPSTRFYVQTDISTLHFCLHPMYIKAHSQRQNNWMWYKAPDRFLSARETLPIAGGLTKPTESLNKTGRLKRVLNFLIESHMVYLYVNQISYRFCIRFDYEKLKGTRAIRGIP